MKRHTSLLLLIAGLSFLLAIASPAQGADAKVDHTITIKIPAVLRLETETTEVIFDLKEEDISLVSYPVYFFPTSGSEYRSVFVFSNLKDEWQLKIRGASEEIPLSNIEWSIDKITWNALSEEGQPLVFGEHTGGWREFRVYYRLVVTGEEYAGTGYSIKVYYELSTL